PDEDRYNLTVDELHSRLTGLLGGRAAEEIVFGDLSTGAEADLEGVTTIARLMVARWGMSPAIGPLAAMPRAGSAFGADSGMTSESLRVLVDDEVRRIAGERYDDALRLLNEHRSQLDALVAVLLERETLNEAEAYQAAGFSRQDVERASTATATS